VPEHRGTAGAWEDLVFKRGRRRVVRMVYEIVTFQALREALRCKGIWVDGADSFRDPEEDLPADFAARLFRSVADILALRPVLAGRGLHLRVESGLLSGIDLASDDPGTKMMVSVLAAVLEFQRDMISENTREGVAAAEASGKTGCR
jgi:hypothetical protein